MYEERVPALSGHGQYRLCKPYQHLQVDASKWIKMTSEQRQHQVKKFESAALRPVQSIIRDSTSVLHQRSSTICICFS